MHDCGSLKNKYAGALDFMGGWYARARKGQLDGGVKYNFLAGC